METENLTWRDKLRILDVSARIAVAMFLACAAVSEIVVVAVNR